MDNKWNYLSPKKTNNTIETESPIKIIDEQKPPEIVPTKSTQNTPDVSFLSEDHSAPAARKTMKYKKGPFIGKGPNSEVFECLSLTSGELLALKLAKVIYFLIIYFQIYGNSLKIANYLENLKKEFANLKNLTHNNTIRYYGCDIVEVKNDFTLGIIFLLKSH